MIKVGIQTYKNTGHQGRGVGVYGAELVKAIKEKNEVEVVEFSELKEIGNVDLVHFLHFDLFQKTLPAKLKIPVVVTVHDVTPLVFPEHYPAGIKGKIRLFWQKNSLKRAAKVITISEASKKDIIKYLGIKEEKIEVIYSGVANHFRKINDSALLKKAKEKYYLPEKFAFYSGNVNWNKNILNMTQACINADLDLVIVGKSFSERSNLEHPEMQSFKEFLQKYESHPKVHILGYIEDEEMVAILNQATVALFTGFYEGFGFPILEAQACEIPVITSNLSSMPEIGGDGALYVDPYKVDEITAAINKVLADESLGKVLIAKGKANADRFSWKKCAEQTIKVYQKIFHEI